MFTYEQKWYVYIFYMYIAYIYRCRIVCANVAEIVPSNFMCLSIVLHTCNGPALP